MKQTWSVRKLCTCAILAALYAVITILTAPLAYGLSQFRLSDALVVLCCFDPALGWGITLGCLLANLFSTVTALDVVIGTLATALACCWTAKCRKNWMIPLPNILLNGLLVGAMLAAVLFPQNFAEGFVLAFAQVAFGEAVVMYALGLPLYLFLRKSGVLSKILAAG